MHSYPRVERDRERGGDRVDLGCGLCSHFKIQTECFLSGMREKDLMWQKDFSKLVVKFYGNVKFGELHLVKFIFLGKVLDVTFIDSQILVVVEGELSRFNPRRWFLYLFMKHPVSSLKLSKLCCTMGLISLCLDF